MLAAPAYAGLEGELSLTYNSQFNYRGANGILADGASLLLGGADTDNTFDAALDLSYGLNDQFSLVAGASINTLSDTSVDHNRYRAGVRYTAECYTLEVGYQYQELSNVLLSGLDTDEIYLNIGTECPLTGGNVNLYIAHDLDLLDGTYAELSWNKAWDLCDKTKVDVTVGVAYSFDYWDNIIATGSDWNHAYITVALPYQATDNLVVTPFVTYSEGFDALDATAVAPLKEDGEFVFGVSASVKF
ncbi:MAG: hypothetical protein KJO21_10240 [Verrucomicrobiae bacterium]|nr:hypothetical protein [Verrucomicrobiae bacterium]NNJ43840.1 hypothetical protein [Akkermansiaceae bacterium]